MSLLLNRNSRSTRYLAWKIRIFAVAAVIAVVGMALENPYVTGVALVLLIIGMLLRLLPEPKGQQGQQGQQGPEGLQGPQGPPQGPTA